MAAVTKNSKTNKIAFSPERICMFGCNFTWSIYGTPGGTFLFQYLPEKKLKQKKLEKKSKQ